jgi:hypothetical protein
METRRVTQGSEAGAAAFAEDGAGVVWAAFEALEVAGVCVVRAESATWDMTRLQLLSLSIIPKNRCRAKASLCRMLILRGAAIRGGQGRPLLNSLKSLCADA